MCDIEMATEMGARVRVKQIDSLLRRLAVSAVFVLLGAFPRIMAAQGTPVQSWITTSNSNGVAVGLQPQPGLSFTPDKNDGVTAVGVNAGTVFQRMEGGGASFTDSAAWLVNENLSPSVRDQVMQNLFDPNAGIGVSFLRNPMGASDLTRTEYTYDDDASDKSDSSLLHFSISHDLADVLPLTKAARRLNPSLHLMMTGWSPPAWMKDNNNLVGGDLLPQFYPHFTNYYVKTIQAYEAQGVPIDYVALNNEPTCCGTINYPSLHPTSAEMITILKNFWFPAWSQNN